MKACVDRQRSWSATREKGGGLGFELSFDDVWPIVGAILGLAVVAIAPLHALASGNWSFVIGGVLLAGGGAVLMELPDMLGNTFEFALDNYEDIKAWIIAIPVVLFAIGVFIGALADHTNVFLALLMGCLSFGLFAALGQLAFWLLEKVVEYWWVIIGLLVLGTVSG